MKEIRVLTVGLIVFLLIVLSQSTDAFWWFKKVNWPAVWQSNEQGLDEVTKACLWAAIHGATSAILGVLIGGELRRGSTSEVEWIVSLIFSFILGAMLTSFGDVTSGWWMIVEEGKYISFAWGAFLQSFLIMFVIALILVPVPDPIKRSRGKKTSGYIA